MSICDINFVNFNPLVKVVSLLLGFSTIMLLFFTLYLSTLWIDPLKLCKFPVSPISFPHQSYHSWMVPA